MWALWVVLLGCRPEDTGDDSGDGPADVATIELSAGTRLLPGIGSTGTLQATAYDAQGEVVDATFSWRTADGAVASVDDGVLTALVGAGHTEVYAEADGVESAPAEVVVATLAEGAVTFTDDALVSGPTFGAFGATYDVVVALGAVPSVGAIVVAAEDAPVAGRVVTASQASEGVALALEQVALTDVFVALDYERAMTVAVPAPARSEFEIGGFECESSSELSDGWPTSSWSVELVPGLSVEGYVRVVVDTAVLEAAAVRATGSLSLQANGTLEYPITWQGSLECKRELSELVFPITGALSFLVNVKIPLGAGFDASGSFEATAVEFSSSGSVGAEVDLGFTYTQAGGWEKHSTFTPTYGLSLQWSSPLLEEGATVKASMFPHFYAELDVGPTFPPYSVELARLKAGLKGEFELTAPPGQAVDPATAAKYQLAQYAEIEPGEDYVAFLELFGVEVGTIELEAPPDAVILKSPEGTAEPDTTEVVADEPVTLTTTFDPATVSFTDGYNIESVHIWREEETGWTEVAEVEATPGQTEFEWEWTPTEQDEEQGDAEFAVFVETVQMPDVQLEIEPDSVQKLGPERILLGNTAAPFELWTMNPDGSDLTRLTTDSANDFPLSFTPDGAGIVYETNGPGQYEVWRRDADGANPTKLGSRCDVGLCDRVDFVAPGRDAFVYDESNESVADVCGADTVDGYYFDVVTLDASTTRLGPYPSLASRPGASGDVILEGMCSDLNGSGGWDRRGLWTVPVAGGGPTALSGAGSAYDSVLAVSAAGHVAVRRSYNDGQTTWTRLYAVHDGATQFLVDHAGGGTFHHVWAPDGQWLVFTRNLNVWRIGADGTGLQQLTTDGDAGAHLYTPARWSPDGRLVFREASAWMIMDADGANRAPLPVPSGYTVADWL